MNIYKYVQRSKVERSPPTSITEKYVPTSLSDVVAADMSLACVNHFFRSFRQGTHSKSLLISGPSGIGKTLIARLAAREHSYDPIVEIPCSVIKTSKEFEESMRCMTSTGAIIVDDLDVVESRVLQDIRDYAKKNPRVPVIYACLKHNYGKPMDLCKTSEVIAMRRPPRHKVLQWTERIAKIECFPETFDIPQVIDHCKGDMRQILLTLEMNRPSVVAPAGKPLVLQKDPCLDATNAVELMMMQRAQDVPVNLAFRLVNLDPSNVMTMISENYLDILGDDIETASRAADSISIADTMEESMYRNQCWELYDSWLFAGAVYPGLTSRRPFVGTPRFTKLWSKTSNMYLRMGHLRRLKTAVPEVDTMDYAYGLSACMYGTMKNRSLEAMVSMYCQRIPHDIVPFVIRLQRHPNIKSNFASKVRLEYQRRDWI
jgi:DNA polymerase III delta prime subunit